MEFYFQIKGKKHDKPEKSDSEVENTESDSSSSYGGWSNYGSGNWSWPPIWSDMVVADNRKEAHKMIEEMYDKKFLTRVLRKDLDSNEFLLVIKELKEDDHYTRSLFDVNECKQCHKKFKVIEKYQLNKPSGGTMFCCYECGKEFDEIERLKKYSEPTDNISAGIHNPVIYRINNKITGMSYIGKTRQAFTFRWYQHFFQFKKDTKFYTAIEKSNVTDWIFEVVETIVCPEILKTYEDVDTYILERETFWINHYDSVRKGYNSVKSVSDANNKLICPEIEFEYKKSE